MTYTLFLVVLTAIISIATFSNTNLYNKLILWPRKMDSPAEYYRLLTSGFIHADWMHLIFNMFALYVFGDQVELFFVALGKHYLFVVMYLLGIVMASLPSFIKHRDNSYYRSLGASGGVAAVLFSYAYLAPWQTIYVWFIPIPSIIAGVLYLVYSAYMSKKGGDNVNHDAHFWGAVFGFIFTFIFDPTHGRYFLEQITHPRF